MTGCPTTAESSRRWAPRRGLCAFDRRALAVMPVSIQASLSQCRSGPAGATPVVVEVLRRYPLAAHERSRRRSTHEQHDSCARHNICQEPDTLRLARGQLAKMSRTALAIRPTEPALRQAPRRCAVLVGYGLVPTTLCYLALPTL
jgi:hypothetical protein